MIFLYKNYQNNILEQNLKTNTKIRQYFPNILIVNKKKTRQLVDFADIMKLEESEKLNKYLEN